MTAQNPINKTFDPITPKEDLTIDLPVGLKQHADSDLHLIEESIAPPTEVRNLGRVASLGTSPFPARANHVHALDNGTAAVPAVGWANDGMWRNGPGVIAFSTLGVNRVNIAAAGITIINGDLNLSAGRAVYAASGRVVVGTSTKSVELGPWSGGATWSCIEGANGYVLLGDGGTNMFVRTNSSSHGLALGSNNTTRLFITPTGTCEFLVGIVDLSTNTTSTTTGYQDVLRNTTSGVYFRFTSSRKFKSRIKSLPGGFSGKIIDELRPVSFIEKAKPGEDKAIKSWREKDVEYGFIAEEVWEVNDGHLSTVEVKDGELIPAAWSVPKMVALLVSEVQQLRQRVAELEGK